MYSSSGKYSLVISTDGFDLEWEDDGAPDDWMVIKRYEGRPTPATLQEDTAKFEDDLHYAHEMERELNKEYHERKLAAMRADSSG